jgi:effector-binding domain-containing protein
MKSLLNILALLGVLFIIALMAGLFLPRSGNVKSEIVINATRELVFEQIHTLKNWENWSPWFESDSTMRFTYSGPVSGTGASYEWKSVHSGKGKLSITFCEPLKKIDALLDFGIQGNSSTGFLISSTENKKTNLTWTYEYANLGYLERYVMILFRKNIQSTFKAGLRNIKKISEQLRLDRISEIKIVEVQQQHSLGILDSCDKETLDERISSAFDKIAAYLSIRKIQPIGQPFIIYYRHNLQGATKFACCMPIAERTWGWKEYSYIEIPQGKAVTLTHWGKYPSVTPFQEIDKFIRSKNLSKGNFLWEVFLNNSAMEPDTSMWKTQIYCPIW